MKQTYLKLALVSVMFCLASIMGYAQAVNDVTLTVSSDGATKEEATKNALRSAIEQAYGTFVSANTTILNDELVKDEIVTIANGNIKSYEEISSTAMPDGSQFVTLKATVSVSKLISYAQSKGAETEFAGAIFNMNMKMKELNKQNEMKVIENLITQINELLPLCYDMKLIIDEPKYADSLSFKKYVPSVGQISFNRHKNFSSIMKWVGSANNSYLIKMMVQFVPNENIMNLKQIITSTFANIQLSREEREEYMKQNIPYTEVECGRSSGDPYYFDINYFYLRNSDSDVIDLLNKLTNTFYNYFSNFKIVDNLNKESSFPQFQIIQESFDSATEWGYKGDFVTTYDPSIPSRYITITPGTNLFSPYIVVYYNFHVNINKHNPKYQKISISFRNFGGLFSPIESECANTVDAIFKSTPTWEITFLMPRAEIHKYNNFNVKPN